MKYDESLDFALKSAFLAFDATRISSNDVDYPIDTVVMENNSYHIVENRFEQHELNHISEFWNNSLKEAINTLPDEVLKKAFVQQEIKPEEE